MKKTLVTILLIAGTLFFANAVFADELRIDTSIPGTSSDSNPVEMIYGFYKFALSISGILAVGVIIFGAVKYMASPGNPNGQNDAREWITSAFWGILLLAGGYLILNTVNPELTLLRLPNLDKINVPEQIKYGNYACKDPGGKTIGLFDKSTCNNECASPNNCVENTEGTGDSGPVGTIGEGLYGFAGVRIPAGTLNDLAVRSALKQMPGVSINKDNCKLPAGQTSCSKDFSSCTDCTSLDGLPQSVILGVKKIWQNCRSVAGTSCVIMVTGGTEAGHSSHRMSLPIIDFRLDPNGLDKYIWEQIGKGAPVCKIHKGKDGISYMRETPNCPWKPAPHWHVIF